ncbi:MAG: hypothetical protein COB45_12315 [Gammaproteobacteria bacterium]|jgi:hypothetical protein|nr:MAG: hypothetical protein COB45_12315 [Gammaproteobacteria bacterium]PHR80534.1 MAG: hypothetical protein COA59_17355 [Colwellia sp.]
MQFTLVIFSTYEFFVESLASEKLAPPFFRSKNSVISKESYAIKFKNNLILKEFFFTSPQLKNTLFKTALMQLIFMYCFFFVYKAIIRICRSMRIGHV